MLRSFKSLMLGSSLFAVILLPTMGSAGGIGAGLDLGPVGGGAGVDTGPGGAGVGANVNVGGANVGAGAGTGWQSSPGYYSQGWQSSPSGYYSQSWQSSPGYYSQGWQSSPGGFYVHDNRYGGWQGGYSTAPGYSSDYPPSGNIYYDNYPYSQYYHDGQDGAGVYFNVR